MGDTFHQKKIKEAMVKIGVQGCMALLNANLPFTRIIIVKQIIQMLVSWVLEMAVHKTEFGSFAFLTGFEVSDQGKEFRQASTRLENLKLLISQEEKEKLEKELVDSARRFIKLNKS